MKIKKSFLIPAGRGGESLDQKGEPRLKQFKPWHILLLILLLAFALRLVLILQPEVIRTDGTEYVRHAKEIAAGNWMGGRSNPIYPALIAFVSPLTKNYEMAGIWVSVIFGILLMIPVFYLGKEIFDKRVGMISGLMAAVHPFLYIYSGTVLTESTYHFFIATSVLFGWYAFSRGTFYYIILFGLFASLAYLTRPEGVGFLFVFCVWVLFFNPPGIKRVWMKRVGIIFFSMLCFLLFSSPYLIQIRKDVGKWQISKKVSFSTETLADRKDISRHERPYVRKIDLIGKIKKPLSLIGKVGIGLLKSFYKFQQVFNPILFLLAVLGWIGIFRLKSSHSFKATFYFLSHHLFFFAFVLPFFWIERRYVSHMVSISIPWAALGCLEVQGWIHRWFERESLRKKVSFILIFLLIGGLFVYGSVLRIREHREIQKEAGLWMKENLPRGVKIMCRRHQEAFYAGLPWIMIPKKSYEDILEIARSKEVKYLIIDEDIEEYSPGFWEKLKEKDLVLLKDMKKKEWRMLIFEIVYPERKEQ